MLLFILSGITFVSGAIGLESIGGIELINNNNNSLLYLLIPVKNILKCSVLSFLSIQY